MNKIWNELKNAKSANEIANIMNDYCERFTNPYDQLELTAAYCVINKNADIITMTFENNKAKFFAA